MTKKIRATIDLDEASELFSKCYGEETNYNRYAEVNYQGACVFIHGKPYYWINFKDIEVIEYD